MSVFQSFYNFMESAIDFISSGVVFQIFMTFFVVWVFALFFKIMRN